MHGLSRWAPRHPRQPERFTATLNVDSSRAEVVNYDDLMACGSMNAAKEKGLVRSEGKEYVMRDGDVVLFRFNV